MRETYEKDIDSYKKIFPIKESDIAEELAEYNNIFAFKEVVSSRKLDGF